MTRSVMAARHIDSRRVFVAGVSAGAENVVRAPQNPVPTRASTQAGDPRSMTAAAVTPRMREPRMLTVKVPHGKTLSCRDWTNRSVR